jgi:Fe-S-cluster containining protein
MSFDCSKCVPKICHGDCCLYVPLPKELWEKFKHLAQQETQLFTWDDGTISFNNSVFGENVLPLTENMMCPFMDTKTFKCVIYEDRPLICRAFGISTEKGLQCYFMKPSGILRGKKDRAKREKENQDNLNRIVGNINREFDNLNKK